MTQNVPKLQQLFTRYQELRRLAGGIRPQRRGEEFNRLIAEMLIAYGIKADMSVRGRGEIDVTFKVNGVRFILEAKWESTKTNTAKVAKLQRRVEQRFVATIGIFLSMSGYSPEAISDLKDSRRLDVLLLDGSHFEAMLSGFVPPDELFDLLADRASYMGEGYYSLSSIFPSPPLGQPPEVEFGAPPELTTSFTALVEDLEVEIILHGLDARYMGLACRSEKDLILTYPDGLVAVDISRNRAGWLSHVTECYRWIKPAADGSLLIRRREGVGILKGSLLSAVGGPFFGNPILTTDDEGHVYVVDNGGKFTTGWLGSSISRDAEIVLLYHSIGQQLRTPTQIPAGQIADAAAVRPERIAAVSASALYVIDVATGEFTQWIHGFTNTMSVCALDETHVLSIANGTTAVIFDIATRTATRIAELHLSGSISDIARSPDGSFFVFSTYPGHEMTYGIVLRISFPFPLRPRAV